MLRRMRIMDRRSLTNWNARFSQRHQRASTISGVQEDLQWGITAVQLHRQRPGLQHGVLFCRWYLISVGDVYEDHIQAVWQQIEPLCNNAGRD